MGAPDRSSDRHQTVVETATIRLLRLTLSFGCASSVVSLVVTLVPFRNVGTVALAFAWVSVWVTAFVVAPVTVRLLRRRPWQVVLAVALASAITTAITGGTESPLRTEASWLGWALTVTVGAVSVLAMAAVLCASVLAGMLIADTTLHDVVAGPDRYTLVTDVLNPLVVVMAALALAGVFRSVLVDAGGALWRMRHGDGAATPGLRALVAGRRVLELPGPRPDPDPLTPAQRVVVSLLADGHTPQQIALLTGRANDTVYEHIANAKKRVGARTIEHLIVRSWRQPT
ncbi:helix-turn-helix transcriptional regulator [Patulibacter sp. NPDC049589]|uniref:helix-turn-helix transcriptional regulator n=1 Tax=Patulibacter sp. NPDC049589 TaxID=3154731 RepID=UPI003414DB28